MYVQGPMVHACNIDECYPDCNSLPFIALTDSHAPQQKAAGQHDSKCPGSAVYELADHSQNVVAKPSPPPPPSGHPTQPLAPALSHPNVLTDEEVTLDAASQSYLTSSWYRATTLSCEILHMPHLLDSQSVSRSVNQSSATWQAPKAVWFMTCKRSCRKFGLCQAKALQTSQFCLAKSRFLA